jgi:class 3 adenylate cyclase
MNANQALALVEPDEALGHVAAPSTLTPSIASKPTQRKVVTVLFIDVKDSMGLSRRVEPEAWWAVSEALFELMCDAADRFGGWVGEFTGDGVNAVFEATGKRDHHARRACVAALWLRDGVRSLAAEVRGLHQLELSVRIGINSGEVLTGTIGHRRRRRHTANGYTVALAKRIEALARPNRICLTEDTAAFITDAFELHDLGAVEVKGADALVRVYELGDRAHDGDLRTAVSK